MPVLMREGTKSIKQKQDLPTEGNKVLSSSPPTFFDCILSAHHNISCMHHDWVSQVHKEVSPKFGSISDVVAIVPKVLVCE